MTDNEIIKALEEESRRLMLRAIRAAAVKEFAERLKAKSRYPMGTIYVEHIDNLVKEFTEGEHYESQRAESNGSEKA